MEIEVGEFVRTDKGIIYKYTQTIKKDIQLQDFINCNDGKITKHSKNLIDLIEEGDYVNGYKITKIIIETNLGNNEVKIHLYSSRENITKENLIVITDCEFKVGTELEPIKTILTHEQYEQNCYRVEE